jgi:phage gp16-like protein
MTKQEIEYMQKLAERIASRNYTRREEIKMLTILSQVTAKMAKDATEAAQLAVPEYV